MSERQVPLGCCIVGNFGRKWRHLETFGFEERHKHLVKVHEVAIPLVDCPLVSPLLPCKVARISTVVRTDKALSLASILVAFMVGHLDLELDVIADVRVLPH